MRLQFNSRRVGLIAFPVLLWLVATFFFFGDIGLWNDDWFYIQRVPETGAIRALVLDRPIHIWRPLYRVVVPALATLLSEHTSVLHFLSAAAHGVTTLLLYMLLRRLGVRRFAATSAALCFMLFPWHTEVVFWCCNLPTALSASIVLLALLYAARGSTTALRAGLAAFVCTFIACCLNEQPALMALAVPIVFLSVRLHDSKEAVSRVRRMTLLTTAPVAAMALYTLLARWIVGPMDIGAGHGLLPPSRWAATVLQFLQWLASTVGSASWMLQAWRHALAAATEYPLRAGVLVAMVLASGVLWVVQSASRRGEESASPQIRTKMFWLTLMGVVIILAPLGPIIGFGYWLNPRVLYPSAIGLAIVVAAVLSGLENRRGGGERHRSRVCVGAVIVTLFAAAAFAMVGIQHAYRERHRLDQQALSDLRALVPHPEPGSVFVPANLEPPPWSPRARVFEAHYWSVLNSWWSAEPALRLADKRSDLRCGFAKWGESAWRGPGVRSVILEGLGRFSWEKVIPFEIDGNGTVRLITDVWLTSRDGVEHRIAVPQTAAIAGSSQIPANMWRFPLPKPLVGAGSASTNMDEPTGP